MLSVLHRTMLFAADTRVDCCEPSLRVVPIVMIASVEQKRLRVASRRRCLNADGRRDVVRLADPRQTAEPGRCGPDAAPALRAAHEVLTGVTVRRGGVRARAVETTTVHLAALDEAETAWRVGTGEPFDKAGGYGAQLLARLGGGGPPR